MGLNYTPRGTMAQTPPVAGARDDWSDVNTAQMPAQQEIRGRGLPRRRKVILGALVLVLALVIALFGIGKLIGSTPRVQLYTAQTQTLTSYVGGGGLTQAVNEQDIAYPVNGQVVSLSVHVGQQVTAGQTLMTLNSADLQQQLQNALVQYQSAQQYVQALLQSGTPYQTIALAQQQEQVAQSLYQTLYAKLHSAEYNNGNIIAKYTGTVTAINVTSSSLFYANQTLITVDDLSSLYVSAQFPLEHRGEVKIGQPAEVDPIATANQTFRGTISGINPNLTTPGSGTFQVLITVPNPSNNLFIGEGVYARVTSQGQYTSVPELAVINPGSDSIVFIYANGRAHLRRVVVGVRDGDRVGITNGLQPGDQVILVGQYQLSDNEPVIVTNS
ncbi:MAG: efflux RND transporter periplasmic adaptor subunit [Ktedonobacterales bacterium]|nr:efflux RND transporter periplasmic adaptor subunit [Ktedonobacterales bacterium]